MSNYSDFIIGGGADLNLSFDGLADGEYDGITAYLPIEAMVSLGLPLKWDDTSGGEGANESYVIASADENFPEMPCSAMAIGDSGGEGASGTVLLYGFIRNDNWSWTVGATIYLGTSGALQTTADYHDQKLGVAMTSNIILFSPNIEPYRAS
jgi:hypothetical protein